MMDYNKIMQRYLSIKKTGGKVDIKEFHQECISMGYHFISGPEGEVFLIYVDESFFHENKYYEKYQHLYDDKRYFVEYMFHYRLNRIGNKKNKTVKKAKKQLVLKRDNFTCKKCGSKENLTVDHIIPWCISKDDSYYNLETLCYTCNHEKDDKIEVTVLE